MTIRTAPLSSIDVVKRAFWLAWQACGGPAGMGVFQDNPGANEDTVWNNVMVAGDYPGKHEQKHGLASGDYVFGRMMKLTLRYDNDTIDVRDDTPRIDYQSWCRKYPTYEALIEAAVGSLLAPANA